MSSLAPAPDMLAPQLDIDSFVMSFQQTSQTIMGQACGLVPTLFGVKVHATGAFLKVGRSPLKGAGFLEGALQSPLAAPRACREQAKLTYM